MWFFFWWSLLVKLLLFPCVCIPVDMWFELFKVVFFRCASFFYLPLSFVKVVVSHDSNLERCTGRVCCHRGDKLRRNFQWNLCGSLSVSLSLFISLSLPLPLPPSLPPSLSLSLSLFLSLSLSLSSLPLSLSLSLSLSRRISLSLSQTHTYTHSYWWHAVSWALALQSAALRIKVHTPPPPPPRPYKESWTIWAVWWSLLIWSHVYFNKLEKKGMGEAIDQSANVRSSRSFFTGSPSAKPAHQCDIWWYVTILLTAFSW